MDKRDCGECLFCESCASAYSGGCCENFTELYGDDSGLEAYIENRRNDFYREWFRYIDEDRV